MTAMGTLSDHVPEVDVPDTVHSEPVTLRRVITAEWTKFRTLRSTVAVLVAAVVGMLAIGLVVAFNTRHLSGNLQPDDLAPSATLQGYYLGQLLIGALGVLFVTGEYSTGMIRSTFAAVPKRLPVLWAKLIVFTVVTAVAMIVISVVAFLAAQGVISGSRTGYSLGDPGVLRVVIGTGVYLTLIGLLGAAIGWLVRSTPGSLVTYIAVILVLPVLFGNVLGHWGKDIAKFLPSDAGGSFVSSLPSHDGPALAPWPGLLVLVVWVIAGIALVAVQLPRRDA
jgi:ABC-2 type transport system permease protein